MTALTHLPSVANATLPAQYQSARQQLAECARVDECKDWADKAAALASYAKQSEDESLEKLARKIRARAIRRCGELLKEIEPSKGGRPAETREGTRPSFTRKSVAESAGMSAHQTKQALRVANVPAEEFEAAVESDAPPTVEALAERGKKKAPRPLVDLGGRSPDDYRAATNAMGRIRDLAELSLSIDPGAVVRGADRRERAVMIVHIQESQRWLAAIAGQMES